MFDDTFHIQMPIIGAFMAQQNVSVSVVTLRALEE
jgi:hypothetical protein